MAEWIAEGEPQLDALADGHPALRRRTTARRRYTLKRAQEVYETYYDIRYPGEERQAGRPLRVSSAYAWHREHGAVFGEKSGWERVNWYESNAAGGRRGAAPARLGRACTGRRRSAPSTWRAASAPALFDESSFAKMEIAGAGRGGRSSRGCATTASRATSAQITYTQMLNPRGGIECDFTVTRVEEELFSIVTGTAFGTHDLALDPPPRAARRRRCA